MNCFERLVKANFLTNARSEFKLARQVLKESKQVEEGFKVYSKDRRSRRIAYTHCVQQFGLIKSMEDSLTEDTSLLFYVQIAHLIFGFSSKKAQIDDAIRQSYNLNGDLPFYRGKHKINGLTFHTVLIDTRFPFTPVSPN